MLAVFLIQIHFLRIRIQDFFPNPNSGSRQQKTNFSKAKTKFWEKILFSTQKFLFSTNQVGILFNRTFIWKVSFLKISENPEKFVEKVDFYSSISLPGSGSEYGSGSSLAI